MNTILFFRSLILHFTPLPKGQTPRNTHLWAAILTALLLPTLTIPASAASVEHINSNAFLEQLTLNPGTLLDVRTEREFANGHLEGAGQLDYYADTFEERLLLLPRDQPVYLYCNTGYRSRRAAKILEANGYSHVFNLRRGIMEWRFRRLPIVVEADAIPDSEHQMQWDEFTALIDSTVPVWIDFYAPWCAPCRHFMPIFDAIALEHEGKARFVKINADASPELMRELGILGVPYIAHYQNGKLHFEHAGMLDKNTFSDAVSASLESAISGAQLPVVTTHTP